ncbi:glycosyltransferase family 4 protein [Asticcacaulis machinosus]|uniref:Glycosyltransferase family 4 protein n=1 Tax=Asticcacaulis machinosus TaxID=2984211 RepID=A0ABT5HJT3_9CAUL|nr:glycosyltransferase family 4 protein [Asticcacaulis machinosus]MDC7676505.1 glycosyltransferase family 4 protein [Asticcacaulis machinosus]
MYGLNFLPIATRQRLRTLRSKVRDTIKKLRTKFTRSNLSYWEAICERQATKAEAFLQLLNQKAGVPTGMDEYQLLCCMFSPSYYSDQLGMRRTRNEAIFEHFLGAGLTRDVSPSPFFDVEYYRSIVADVPTDESSILHWLREGRSKQVVPTKWFDTEFYLEQYPDVKASGIPAFEHFVRHGLAEDRRALSWFDPVKYKWFQAKSSEPLYQAFLADGLSLFKPFSKISGIPECEVLSNIADVYLPLQHEFEANDFVKFWNSFSESHYRLKGRFDSSSSKKQLALHFLSEGVWRNLSPSPDFSPEIYSTALASGDPQIQPVYWYWLTEGRYGKKADKTVRSKVRVFRNAIETTNTTYFKSPALKRLDEQQRAILENLFQPDFYARHANLPITRSPTDLYDHFLSTGLTANTPFSPLFNDDTYRQRAAQAGIVDVADGEPAVLHWLFHGVEKQIVPTTLFSNDYYFSTNRDLAKGSLFGFEHFILHGQFEGREAAAWLDRKWYSPEDSRHNLIFFFCHHLWEGFTPNAALETLRPHLGEHIKSLRLYEKCIAPLYDRYGNISAEDFNILGHSAVPFYYTKKDEAKSDLLIDFLCEGMWQGRPSNPLFSHKYYREALVAKALEVPISGPLFLHWLFVGRRKNIIPTALFDEACYRNCNGDLIDAAFPLFEHFYLHGVYENRVANPLFDPHWYRYQAKDHYAIDEMPLLLHYAAFNEQTNFTPCRMVACLAHDPAEVTIALYENLLVCLRPLTREYGIAAVQFAISLFVPDMNAIESSETTTAFKTETAFDQFKAHIENVISGGYYSSALFDPDYYGRAAKLKKGTKGLLQHFLRVGILEEIQPAPLFDAKAYLAAYSDINEANIWPYLHFVLYGIYEGRSPNQSCMLALAPGFSETDLPAFVIHWHRFWRNYARLTVTVDGVATMVSLKERIDSVLKSAVFSDVIARAQFHDPEIGQPKLYNEIILAPLHDQMGFLQTALQSRFSQLHYDNIICVPWIRMGGADLVACLLAQSLKEVYPNERNLILRVDYPNFERPDWLPDNVDIVDISDIIQGQSPSAAELLLYGALTGLTPKRVFNINSRLTWTTLRRFGRRLSLQTKLYAYLFCWDMANGVRAGYPSEFYPTTAAYLTGLFTDTAYLKNELIRMFAPPVEYGNRIYPLHTPIRGKPPEMVITDEVHNVRPKVLWAARLDPQKRFDLVLKVAKAMPHVDFECWGAAVLEREAPDMRRAPKNLRLNPPFKSYDELPLEHCDVWLFTAEWEGLPTILIELGARGMPIVASAVGGVPELINLESGWLIEDIEDISAYVSAIDEAIGDRSLRNGKCKLLYERTQDRHSRAQYITTLKAALEKAST